MPEWLIGVVLKTTRAVTPSGVRIPLAPRAAANTPTCVGGDLRLRFGAVPRQPRLTGAELVRALQRLGWEVVVLRGSHVQLRHSERGGRVTVPVHAGKVLGPGLTQAILKEAGVDANELRRVL